MAFEQHGMDVFSLRECLLYADYLYIFTRIHLYSQNLLSKVRRKDMQCRINTYIRIFPCLLLEELRIVCVLNSTVQFVYVQLLYVVIIILSPVHTSSLRASVCFLILVVSLLTIPLRCILLLSFHKFLSSTHTRICVCRRLCISPYLPIISFMFSLAAQTHCS